MLLDTALVIVYAIIACAVMWKLFLWKDPYANAFLGALWKTALLYMVMYFAITSIPEKAFGLIFLWFGILAMSACIFAALFVKGLKDNLAKHKREAAGA